MAGEAFRFPFGATFDDDEPNGFVKLTAVIPEIKKKKKGGLIPDASNIGNGDAKVKFEDEDVTLTVQVDEKNKTTQYGAHWRLPESILPGKSYMKCEKGQVQLYLKKAENKTWAGELSSGIPMEVVSDPL